MSVFLVYVRYNQEQSENEIVFVRDDFSWAAAMLMPLWAFWKRSWESGIIICCIIGGFAVCATTLGGGLLSNIFLWIGCGVTIGYTGNDLRKVFLLRQGFMFNDIVFADNDYEAERRFIYNNYANQKN